MSMSPISAPSFAFARPHEAQAALAVMQPAVARTQVALQPAVVQPVPPTRRVARVWRSRVVAHGAACSWNSTTR